MLAGFTAEPYSYSAKVSKFQNVKVSKFFSCKVWLMQLCRHHSPFESDWPASEDHAFTKDVK